MKKIIDLALRRAKGKVNANLYIDDSDNPYDVVKELRELFDNAKCGLVRVRIIADDGTEKEEVFNRDLAVEVFLGKVKGRFVTFNGEDVNIVSCELNGDYPFLGIINGSAMQWNNYGHRMNAEPNDTSQNLKIIVSLKK